MSQGVSDEEIAREVRTLRNLRRRSGSSTGPGALPLDPDSPPPSPSGPSTSTSSSSSAFPSYSSNDDITLSSADGLDGDNAGLFWVPAHLHPELAPGEFRAFLKSHTSSDPEHADASDAGDVAGLARSPSFLARNGSRRGDGGLGRKRSMLSRQYQPKAGDKVEEEVPPLPSRQRGSIYGGRSGEKGLTLQDLQRLETVMDEAGDSDDPDQMRSLLRRSLSTNVAPGFLQDDVPLDGDESQTPLARPGSIIRRSARTKIRRAGLSGDGGGHRFAATRKGRMTAAPVIDIPGLEDDDDPSRPRRRHTGSDESEEMYKSYSADSHGQDDDDSGDRYHDAVQHLEARRPSDASTETDETQIFDAYARDSRSSSMSGDSSISESSSPSPEGSPPNLRLDLPTIPRSTSGPDWFKDGEKTPTQETMVDPLRSVRRSSPDGYEDGSSGHGSGMSHLSVPDQHQQHQQQQYRGPPSPTTPKQSAYELPPGMAPPAQRSALPPGMAMQQQLQQQTASATKEPLAPPPPTLSRTDSHASQASQASTVSTASQKSTEKEKEKEKKGGFFSKKEKEKDKDKDKKGKKDKDRFLGSLFGGNKKKTEEPSSVSNFSSAGPAAAAALLGSSKSAKSLGLSPVPSPTSPGFNSYSRYPIHVERAVYRLSHIKLANARRPLYEQVLISNLMFWYLGVIGRNVAEEKKANGDEEKKDSAAAKTPAAKGTPPKPTDSGSAGKPLPREEVVSVKKTGLTKPDRSRQPGRDAEAPVRSPSYGMQHAQVDSEIRSAGMKGPRPPSQHQQAPPYERQQNPPPASQHNTQYSQPPPQSRPPQPSPPQQQQQQHPPQQQPQRELQQQQQQPPYAHLQQQSRSNSIPPPGRALSPPGPGQQRPTSEYGMGPGGPRDPRDIRTDHRSPSPGYSPSPASTSGGMSASQSMHDMRDGRQRTYSNPGPQQPVRDGQYPPHQGQPAGHMRRAVSEAQPQPASSFDPRQQQGTHHSLSPPPRQHSGPQPGQIFHHPSSPGFRPPSPSPQGVQPGQRYGPPLGGAPSPTYGGQPGQIFRPPHSGAARPPPAGWEAPQRLPPGATPPEYGVPPHLRRPPPPAQGQPAGYEQRSYSNPPYPQGQPRPAPMTHGQSGPGAPGYYPPQHAGQGPAPGQGGPRPQFSPYAVPPPPQPGREGDYRRPQPVQQGAAGGAGYHHR